MKAAQALSGMIHLDRLIAALMQVVNRSAGSQSGALVTGRGSAHGGGGSMPGKSADLEKHFIC